MQAARLGVARIDGTVDPVVALHRAPITAAALRIADQACVVGERLAVRVQGVTNQAEALDRAVCTDTELVVLQLHAHVDGLVPDVGAVLVFGARASRRLIGLAVVRLVQGVAARHLQFGVVAESVLATGPLTVTGAIRVRRALLALVRAARCKGGDNGEDDRQTDSGVAQVVLHGFSLLLGPNVESVAFWWGIPRSEKSDRGLTIPSLLHQNRAILRQ